MDRDVLGMRSDLEKYMAWRKSIEVCYTPDPFIRSGLAMLFLLAGLVATGWWAWLTHTAVQYSAVCLFSICVITFGMDRYTARQASKTHRTPVQKRMTAAERHQLWGLLAVGEVCSFTDAKHILSISATGLYVAALLCLFAVQNRAFGRVQKATVGLIIAASYLLPPLFVPICPELTFIAAPMLGLGIAGIIFVITDYVQSSRTMRDIEPAEDFKDIDKC